MFRMILSALAALVVVRLLFGLIQGIAAGLREGAGDRPVGGGRSGAGERSPSRPTIDRDKVIDVSYTEVQDEKPSEAGRESRAG